MGWQQIRGHDAVREHLMAAHRRGRLAQSFLFVGPDGVGKRLFATVFAKALLCEAPTGPLQPCDRCPACKQVMAGTHPDFFTAQREEDKNELSVKVMREFLERLGLKPTRGMRKIGLVEDADDFNDSSANAFLKSLEEPPPGSVLILLATSTDHQLPTILSRCQVMRFNPLPPDQVRAVLTTQGITEPARVERLLRLAGGSPGRAIALNDDAFWTIRETLAASLSAAKPEPTRLLGEILPFIESAGKQSAAQRGRASLVVSLMADVLRQSLREAVGHGTSATQDPDRIMNGIEACLTADIQIARYVQVALVFETLLDKLYPPVLI